MMKVEDYDRDAVESCLSDMLDSFSESLLQLQSIPELPNEGYTQLDRLTRDQRIKECGSIRDDCDSIKKTLITSEKLHHEELVDKVEGYINQLKNMAFEV